MRGNWGPRLGTIALAVVPVAFLGVFFLLPLTGMLAEGFWVDGALDLSALTETLARPRVHRVLWFTAWSSLTATAVTLVLGLPVAYVLYRLDFPGRQALRALVVMPFVLPTVVVGVAFRTLFASAGPLGFLGLDGSALAILAALIFFNLAVVVRTVGGLWEGLDRRREDAAAALGASPWQVLRTVTLPALKPGIVSAATVVFLFCSTAFGVVLTLGGLEYGTVETEIYILTTQFLDLPAAAVLSVVQLLAVVVLLLLAGRARGKRAHALERIGARARGRRPGRRDLPALAVTALVVGLLAAPLVTLVTRSLRVGDGWGSATTGAWVRRGRGLRCWCPCGPRWRTPCASPWTPPSWRCHSGSRSPSSSRVPREAVRSGAAGRCWTGCSCCRWASPR